MSKELRRFIEHELRRYPEYKRLVQELRADYYETNAFVDTHGTVHQCAECRHRRRCRQLGNHLILV